MFLNCKYLYASMNYNIMATIEEKMERIKEIAKIEKCEITTMKVNILEIGMYVELIGNEENTLISGYGIKEMEKIAQFEWISITNKKISVTFFIKY